jgi:hypothetical protein
MWTNNHVTPAGHLQALIATTPGRPPTKRE